MRTYRAAAPMQPARAAVAKANRAAPATMVIMADLLSGQTGQPLSAPRFRTAGAISFYAPPSCGIISMRPGSPILPPRCASLTKMSLCAKARAMEVLPPRHNEAALGSQRVHHGDLPCRLLLHRSDTALIYLEIPPPSTAAMSPAKPPSTDGSYQPRSSTSASCWDGYSRNGLLSQP